MKHEDHVEVALAQQRPVYRTESIDALTRVLIQPFDDLEVAYRQLHDARAAGLRGTGYALDLVGRIVSLRRGGAADEGYRLAVAARIAALNSSGTPEDLIAVLRSVLPQDAARPTRVTFRRGARVALLEVAVDASVAPPLDWVPSPVLAGGYATEELDGSYNAGEFGVDVLHGTWPEVGRFRITGPGHDPLTTYAYAATGPLSWAISPPLAAPIDGGETLVGPLGIDLHVLTRHLREVLLPAASAGDDVQVAAGLVGPAQAFTFADAIHLTAPSPAATVVLTTTAVVSGRIPATGYCHPPGSPVLGYRVTAPGTLVLATGLTAPLSSGDLVPLVTSTGAAASPGLGFGAGALYSVAGLQGA